MDTSIGMQHDWDWSLQNLDILFLNDNNMLTMHPDERNEGISASRFSQSFDPLNLQRIVYYFISLFMLNKYKVKVGLFNTVCKLKISFNYLFKQIFL